MARKGRTKAWIVAVAILAILMLAWIDGGEEPLRPVETPLVVPEPLP